MFLISFLLIYVFMFLLLTPQYCSLFWEHVALNEERNLHKQILTFNIFSLIVHFFLDLLKYEKTSKLLCFWFLLKKLTEKTNIFVCGCCSWPNIFVCFSCLFISSQISNYNLINSHPDILLELSVFAEMSSLLVSLVFQALQLLNFK